MDARVLRGDRPRVAEVAERTLRVLLVVRDAGKGEKEGGVVRPRRGRRLQRLARQRELALPRVGCAERRKVGGSGEPLLPERLDHPDHEVVPAVCRRAPGTIGRTSSAARSGRASSFSAAASASALAPRAARLAHATASAAGRSRSSGGRRSSSACERSGSPSAWRSAAAWKRASRLCRLVAEDRLVRRERLARRARVLRRVLLVETPEVEPRVRVAWVALHGLAEAPLGFRVAALRGGEHAEEVPDGRARRVGAQGLVEVRARRRLVARLDVVARARQEVGERRRGLGRREEDQEREDHRGYRGRASRARTGYYRPMSARVRALAFLALLAASATARAAQVARPAPLHGRRPGRRRSHPPASCRRCSPRAWPRSRPGGSTRRRPRSAG